MANPWEEYQSAPVADSGPWNEYAKADVKPMSKVEKVVKGITDPIDGGAQLLTHILPTSIVDAGNSFNNWLADKTGLVAKVPERNLATVALSSEIGKPQFGIDKVIADKEAEYQAKRVAAGESGFDGYRVLGSVLSPANLALATKSANLIANGGKLANAVASGGVSALLNPVEGGDYATEKAKQVAAGAAGGAATLGLTKAASRFVSPNASVNPQLQTLKDSGVTPSIGQTLGGWANRLEEKLQSVPIMGDAIAAARQKPMEQLNVAAVNRSLAPINESLPKGVTGNDAITFAYKKLGDAYDNLLPKMKVGFDAPFMQKVSSLQQMVTGGALDPKYTRQFDNFLADRVLSKFQGQGVMTGETFKDVQSTITNEVKRYGASQDPDARMIGDALKELGSQLNQLSIRSNPSLAAELKAINTGYANFKIAQKASSSVAAENGEFTASQLHNAVKAADRSKDKARFAEGNALMQDLSGAGKTVLANKVPNSGTADRLLWGGGSLLGGYALNPAIPAGLLSGAAAYSTPVQSLLRGAVSSRPSLAKPVADAFQKAAPALFPGGAQVGIGLLSE